MFNIFLVLNKKINFLKKYKLLKKKHKFNNFEYIFSIENRIFNIYEFKFKNFKEIYLRCKAEFENFKKISNQEMSKSYKYSLEDFSENLLPVLDSLESSLSTNFSKIEDVLEGIRLTLKILVNCFNKKNINPILPKEGDVFDPHKHLAISKIFCEGKRDNVIINVLQKGYFIFDRVLRPALVVVNKVNI